MRSLSNIVFAFVLATIAGQGIAGVVLREDLSECPLPNGITVLPERDSPKAGKKNEFIFKFSGQRLSEDPFHRDGKEPESVEEAFTVMRAEGTGDMWYSQDSAGIFIAVSGRIADLGEHFLYEFNGRKFSRPGKVFWREDKNEPPMPGAIDRIRDGHCYLVETIDGKFALVRLISQGDRTGTIQWVYQPDGSRKFTIPQGKLLPPSSDEKVEKKAPDHSPKPAEDLSQCPLPHGTAILAKEGSARSSKLGGSFFKFADRKYYLSPFREENKTPGSASALLKALRDRDTGDIFYIRYKGGGLFSVSGRIADLGEHFLWEFDKKELSRPKIGNYYEEDREKIPGMANPIETGHCYLVETVDGKFAIVRLLRAYPNEALIQWVYQPNGTRVFTIPKGQELPPEELAKSDAQQQAPAHNQDKTVEGPREDLSECPLPHGTAVLPQRDSVLAEKEKGYIFKFSDGALHLDPFAKANKDAESVQDFFEQVCAQETGDIAYSSLNGGTFVALSGRIRHLGQHFLHEFVGKRLTRPEQVMGTKQHSAAGERTPGAIEGIFEGHCYLLETIDGKFALVRLISQGNRAALVQWVYQPDGTRIFTIPKSKNLPQRPFPAWSARDPVKLMQMEKSIEECLANRKALVATLTRYLEEEPSQRDMPTMVLVIRALGDLRDPDAVDALLNHIAFPDLTRMPRSLTIPPPLPSVSALIDIGKPATQAILARIRKAASDEDVARALEKSSELRLYVKVLAGVDGQAAAEFLLKSEIEKIEEEKRGVYRKALTFIND